MPGTVLPNILLTKIKLKIVIVNDFSIARGGATGLALLSVKKFIDMGFDVTYICGDDGDDALTKIGVSVVSLAGNPLLTSGISTAMVRGMYNLQAYRLLMKFVQENDSSDTVYHVHGWAQILSPSVFRALDQVKHRVFVHAHDLFLVCPNGGFMDYKIQKPCTRLGGSLSCIKTNCDKRSYLHKLWRISRHASLKISLDHTSRGFTILAIHEGVARRIIEGGYVSENVKILRNPVVSTFAGNVQSKGKDKFYYIGRLQEEKGIRDVLEAASVCGAQLCVVGSGILEAELRECYPNVEFLGWKSQEELAKLLVKAKAVIMPSKYPEPFGLVAAEAICSGIPVIVNDSAYLAEEIRSLNVGLVYESGSIIDLAKKVSEFMRMERRTLQDISLRCKRVGKEIFYNEEIWIAKMLASYRESLSFGAGTQLNSSTARNV